MESWGYVVVIIVTLVSGGALLYLWRERSKLLKTIEIANQRIQRLTSTLEQREEETNHLENLELEIKNLQKEIQLKNKEITKGANTLMNTEKKLSEIRKLANENLRDKNNPKRSRNLNTIRRIVDTHLNQEKDSFSVVFDENNDTFYRTLKEHFPDLTLNNLRLAAYIRAGFTSKEIAEIQNVLPSSIIVNRSRLRKKLALDTSQDLYDFLIQYK